MAGLNLRPVEEDGGVGTVPEFQIWYTRSHLESKYALRRIEAKLTLDEGGESGCSAELIDFDYFAVIA
jgi:hypothetical protein